MFSSQEWIQGCSYDSIASQKIQKVFHIIFLIISFRLKGMFNPGDQFHRQLVEAQLTTIIVGMGNRTSDLGVNP